ncbi:MAG TPA: metallophosphoesterase family protein [Fimbriimonadaceae bacterium]|nr:metallophosphoesterase family protein [Fimbriimonadaceae bacterium]
MHHRVAALYDIHGNLPALRAVIDEVRAEGVDAIVFGGDFLPGPLPRATLDAVLDLDIPSPSLRGNGDRVVLRYLDGLDIDEVAERFRPSVVWNAGQLLPRHVNFLRSLPTTIPLSVQGVGRVHFCHATPFSDTDIFTADTPSSVLEPLFAEVDADLIVCGHTHMQFDRMVGGKRIVNAGSVGMPHGDPGAYWLLLGPSVELRKTDYDLEAAEAVLRQSESPVMDIVVESIRNPKPANEMRKLFTEKGLK